jgi:diguanylate cyclase (GGDEF)-like protein
MPDTSTLTLSQYQSVCDSLPDPTFILTESGRYAALLGGKDKRYYHDGSGLVGKWIADVLTASKAQWFMQQIHHALASKKMLVVEYELSAHDVLGLPTDGPVEPIWFEGRITALEQLYGGEKAVVWVASNITASKRMQQLLQQQAMCDELTGLPNRRRLMQVLEQAYADFCSQNRSACLMSFDVDHFKAINDGLGHPAGDRALRDLARAVQQLAAAQDWVCRLGGDEFAIVCQDRSLADITAFAQQLLQTGRQVLQPYATQGPAPALSLGIAHFLPSDLSMEDIMRRADQALYISKTQGGHQVSSSYRYVD